MGRTLSVRPFAYAKPQTIGEVLDLSDVRGRRDYRLAMLEVMSRQTLDAALDRLRQRGAGT